MKKYEFCRCAFETADEYFRIIKEKMALPDDVHTIKDFYNQLVKSVLTPCEICLIGFNREENDYNKKYISLINNCFFEAKETYPDRFIIKLK